MLLLEKQVNLGGLATSGLISWYEPLCDSKGNQVVLGIAEEITEFMLAGKRRMPARIRERDRYSYDIMSIPSMPQLRTIRNIVGDSDFKAVNGNKVFDRRSRGKGGGALYKKRQFFA